MAKSILFPAATLAALVVATTPVAAPAVAERPKLWSIEVMDGDKALSRVDICADSALQKGFTRPAPEVNGQSCDRLRAPIETADAYSLRCHVGDRYYRARAETTGDRARDFTVAMTVKRQDRKEPMYEQVRRYRLVGACPAGWRVGDSAAPGDKQLLDTISGARRPMPPAGG
jgi:hypothetical protein